MPTTPFDLNVFRWLNGLAGTGPAFDWMAVFAARWAIYVLLLGVAVGAVWSVRRLGDDGTRSGRLSVGGLLVAGRVLVAVPLALLDSWLLALLLFRDRPFAALDGVNLLIDPPLFAKSFPSDHATISFVVAVSVLWVSRRWGIVALLLAILVALGRVVVGVHFPFDVLVGSLLGTTWACVMAVIGRKYEDRNWLVRLVSRRKTLNEND